MTDLSITIYNGFGIVGVEPAVLWASGNWGSLIWGSSGDWKTDVIKGIDNSLSPTTALAFDVRHRIDVDLTVANVPGFSVLHGIDLTLTPDSDVGKQAVLTIDNTITATEDMARETLGDSNGYSYVFPSGATNLEDRDDVTWTSGTTAAASWSSQAAGSTTWS